MVQNDKKNSVPCTPYLRKYTYDCHLWYTSVKCLYLHVLFSLFQNFDSSGSSWGKTAKYGPRWQKIMLVMLHISGTIHHDFHLWQIFRKRCYHSFREIYYCSLIRQRNTNLSVSMQCQNTRTILRNKNMAQSLFKKHLKFQNFNKNFYCDMVKRRHK